MGMRMRMKMRKQLEACDKMLFYVWLAMSGRFTIVQITFMWLTLRIPHHFHSPCKGMGHLLKVPIEIMQWTWVSYFL